MNIINYDFFQHPVSFKLGKCFSLQANKKYEKAQHLQGKIISLWDTASERWDVWSCREELK